MALYTKLRLVAVKQEAALGTGIATTVADFEAWDVIYTPSIEYIEREGLGSLSPPPGVTGQASGQVTFKTYLRASAVTGDAPLYLERLFPMLGYAQALEAFSPSGLTPAIGQTPAEPLAVLPITGTVSSYESGLRKTISGAMGTAKLMLTAGQPAVMEYTFTGRYEGEAAAVNPVSSTTLVTQTLAEACGPPMKFAGATLSFTDGVGCVEAMQIDLGNQVVLRPCATEATGFSYAVITGRKVTGSFNPEAVVANTVAHYLGWKADTSAVLSLVLTDGVTTCTIGAPVCRRTNIQGGDRNGLMVDQIDFACHKSATAGNDELTFTFA